MNIYRVYIGIYIGTRVGTYVCRYIYSRFLFITYSYMTIISVKFYNFGTSIIWTKNFARNLPKYRGFTVLLFRMIGLVSSPLWVPGNHTPLFYNSSTFRHLPPEKSLLSRDYAIRRIYLDSRRLSRFPILPFCKLLVLKFN